MATTVENVRRHLEEDPALVDVLRRDLVNLRGTARWLIEEYGWDTTEEAVVSALRRFREEGPEETVWSARRDLHRSSLELRDGLALVTIPRTPEVQRASLVAWFDADGTGILGILPGRTETRLLVEERAIRGLSDELGPRSLDSVEAPVAVLRLILPDTQNQAAILSLTLSALAHKHVPLLELVSCDPEWLLVIPDRVTLKAHGILGSLTSDEAPL